MSNPSNPETPLVPPAPQPPAVEALPTPEAPTTATPAPAPASAPPPAPPTQPIKDIKRVQAFLKKIGRSAQIDPDEVIELVSLDDVVKTTKSLPVRPRRGRSLLPSGPLPTAPIPAGSMPVGISMGQSAPSRPLATLEAQEVSAWFGNHKVLDRVSLTMAAGRVTALIGPSGCGKSTFLRTLNRMHEQVASARFSGSVLLDGRDIYDPKMKITEARTHIGMVFQRPNPFPAMSIYDNVISGLKLEGIRASRDEKDELVEKSLIRAGLWNEVRDRLAQPGGGLSGGQQQRLCIARALAVNPRVLLMDEPCSALDPTSTRVIEETMSELQKEVTIVIVTHNMQQAQRVSQQCAFFLASQGTPGAIVEYGDTEAMFDSPQDGRTRDYVNGRFG